MAPSAAQHVRLPGPQGRLARGLYGAPDGLEEPPHARPPHCFGCGRTSARGTTSGSRRQTDSESQADEFRSRCALTYRVTRLACLGQGLIATMTRPPIKKPRTNIAGPRMT